RRIQIVSGLPGAPSVRNVDGSFLGAPTAIAVSDDGGWLAASSANGAYVFGPDGAAAPIPVDGVVALAFFSQGSDLALATATQVLTVTGLDNARAGSVLYRSTIQPPRAQARSFTRPVAIAATVDN